MKNILLPLLLGVTASCSILSSDMDKRKIVWREMTIDPNTKMEYSILALDNDYFKTITDEQKAALGYVITFVGNECKWERNETTKENSYLRCTILTALDLDYQGSDKHLMYLHKWFEKDKTVRMELQSPPLIPETSTIQNTFNSIAIEKVKKQLIITTEESEINVRNDFKTIVAKKYYFSAFDTSISLDSITETSL